MSDGFYRAFEDKHRGTLALIKERQSIYLPLIRPLLEIYPRAPAIDLGCGRGEWLELLTETGFDALGIDLDDGPRSAPHARPQRLEGEIYVSRLAREILTAGVTADELDRAAAWLRTRTEQGT